MSDAFLLLPFLGILAGFLSGLLGIGGGIVLVPALIFLLPLLTDIDSDKITVVAIATSLITIVVTTFSSARSHYLSGNLQKEMTVKVASGVALFSLLASFVASGLSSKHLTLTFATLLIVLAIQIFIGRHKQAMTDVHVSTTKLFLGGGLTGFLGALAGLGGGAILVPYLSHMGVNIRYAIASGAGCGIVVAIFGSTGYLIASAEWQSPEFFVGYVYWPAALAIVLFSYFSAPFGVKVGQKLNQAQLKKVFAVFMIIVSLRLFMQQL